MAMLRACIFTPNWRNPMSTQTVSTTTCKPITVDRAALIHALDRAKLVCSGRSYKPILNCVHLEAVKGLLLVRATDLEVTALLQVPTDGTLPACAIPCGELYRRLKASKSPSCTLGLDAEADQLIINGGRVEHALQTLDSADFPVVPNELSGGTIEVNAEEFCHALGVAGVAVARETTRYALNGMLLESDQTGTRLVATDGRRLVMVELREAGQLEVQTLLPQRFCKLIEKYTAKDTEFLVLAVQTEKNDKGEPQPSRLFAAGPDWLISTYEIEGDFPRYRDVVPKSHSKFAVDGRALRETLSEVALATSDVSRMVRTDLTTARVILSAESAGVGKSEASLPAEFLGGGDPEIHTAFNPAFLLDALKTLGSAEVVIDVDQNGLGCDGAVFAKPALLYARHEPVVRWVLMPVNRGLEATRPNLGSNYPDEEVEP
jgi:DNA polymerase-3 subunit beta